MHDERDELLERIEAEAHRFIPPLGPIDDRDELRATIMNIRILFERARVSGTVKYPRP